MNKFIVILNFCIGLILFEVSSVHAQSDSIGVSYFKGFSFFNSLNRSHLAQADSTLQYHYFFDKGKHQQLFTPSSGNPGAASMHLFSSMSREKLISGGFDQFNDYMISPIRSFPADDTVRRFTNIDYHLASKKEQHIFITHEQRIKPWLLAGLDFGAFTSPGDFSRQLNTNRNFDIWFAYESPSHVYRSYVSYTSNKIQNQENGGISADSVFENATALDTRTLPVNLDNAFIRHKSRDYLIKQNLNISELFRGEAANQDSTYFQSAFSLNILNWWSRKSVLFSLQSPDSGYFSNFFSDSVSTLDSTFINDFTNQALLEYSFGREGSFKLGAGARHQHVSYYTGDNDTSFTQLAGVVSVSYQGKKVNASAFILKSVSGDFEGTYDAALSFDYKRNGFISYLHFATKKVPQSLRNRFYISNHFIWNNDFDHEQRYEFSGGVSLSKLNASISFQNITSKNLVFFHEDYLPQIFNKFVSYGEVSLNKHFNFGKFGMDDKFTFGYSGNSNVVSLPDYTFFSALYYRNLLFRNALGLKIGADVMIHSRYNAYGYMPATGIFYIQDDKQTGNFPVAGVFASLKIKTATIMIRLDHFNAGIGERNYYGAYQYPLPGRTFKFGVKWDLTD